MEAFKIDNFNKEHLGKTFPKFSSLSQSELESIQNDFKNKLKLSPETNLLTLTNNISSISEVISGVNATDSNFDFAGLLANFGINPKEKIYINWYQYDDIDVIFLKDFCSYFDDIWYPSSDDIDVFDSTKSWIVSIHHDGVVSVCPNILD